MFKRWTHTVVWCLVGGFVLSHLIEWLTPGEIAAIIAIGIAWYMFYCVCSPEDISLGGFAQHAGKSLLGIAWGLGMILLVAMSGGGH